MFLLLELGNMITYKQAAKAVAWVIFFHIIGLIALYSWYPGYDIFMHFAGGAAMAVLGFAMFDHLIKNVTFKSKKIWVKRLFYFLVIVGFVMIIGVAWEWHEYISDQLLAPLFHWTVPAQPSVSDTMKDLLDDFLGAVCVVLWRGL